MKATQNFRWDWPAAVLLVVAVFTSSARLYTTNWTPDLIRVEFVAVLGSVLGLALGYSRFHPLTVRVIVAGYSLVIIPAQLCRIITGESTALGQLASVAGRLEAAFLFILSRKPIEDHLFFVTLMMILFWTIGIYSGYRLVKAPAILAVVLPSTLPILIIQYYDGYKAERIWGLAAYFFIALLLIGRMNLNNARLRWKEQNIEVGSQPEFDLNVYITVGATIIIMVAWMLPAPAAILPVVARAWISINQPFDGARQRINDMLAALHGINNPNSDIELFGSVMGLGRNASSGTNELFTVHVPKNNQPPLYWRMRSYDTYTGGNWMAANTQKTLFDPDKGSLERKDIRLGPTGEFTFSWKASPTSLLVTPALPVWASRTGWLQTAIRKDTDFIDPLSWNSNQSIQTGDQFQVRALLLNPTRKELRNAGSEYPQWIKDHYLQIPATISPEFSQLAAQIMSGKDNSFDRVEAVTSYLRQSIRYSATIPAAPAGTDPLVWFLFTWKSGFCNYYASAEVLLLRSQGIPARMVVGYSKGNSDEFGTYSVLAENAHAWPEVYFPEIGWVEFEPTVIQDPIVRPSGEDQSPGVNQGPPPPIIRANDSQRATREAEDLTGVSKSNRNTLLGLARETWLWVIISVIAIISTGLWGWKLSQSQSFNQRVPLVVRAVYSYYHLKNPSWLESWVKWSEVSAVERAFHSINQSLAWLTKPQPIHATPAERAQLLKSLVPDASQEIDALSAALEQTVYGAHPAGLVNAVKMGWLIRFYTIRTILFGRFYTKPHVESE
jgi:transglutaminase-like putative cysteine protease